MGYFPFNAKLCLNGHEYLKRQLAPAGIQLGGAVFDGLQRWMERIGILDVGGELLGRSVGYVHPLRLANGLPVGFATASIPASSGSRSNKRRRDYYSA